MTATRTYALLEVPQEVLDLVRAKLEQAGYDHAVIENEETHLDMDGIALVAETEPTIMKRYDFHENDNHGELVEMEDGGFVHWDDVEHLLIARLEAIYLRDPSDARKIAGDALDSAGVGRPS